jgi:hypothetical protein
VQARSTSATRVCPSQARDFCATLRLQGDPGKWGRLRELSTRAWHILQDWKTKLYPDAIPLWFMMTEYWEVVGHPALDLLSQNPDLCGEEGAERSLASLAKAASAHSDADEASVMDTCYKRVGFTQALHPESRANLGCSLQDTYHCNVATNLPNETGVAQTYMREVLNALTARTWKVFMANDVNPKKSDTITDKKIGKNAVANGHVLDTEVALGTFDATVLLERFQDVRNRYFDNTAHTIDILEGRVEEAADSDSDSSDGVHEELYYLRRREARRANGA